MRSTLNVPPAVCHRRLGRLTQETNLFLSLVTFVCSANVLNLDLFGKRKEPTSLCCFRRDCAQHTEVYKRKPEHARYTYIAQNSGRVCSRTVPLVRLAEHQRILQSGRLRTNEC